MRGGGVSARLAAAVDLERVAEALPDLVASLPSPLAPLAERVLGLDAEIDLVARDADGAAVVVRAAAADATLAALADVLAQCAWLGPRLHDWRRLAPHLGLAPARGARGLLVAPGFDARTRAAAAAHGVALARVLALEVDGRSLLLLEPLAAETARPALHDGASLAVGADLGTPPRAALDAAGPPRAAAIPPAPPDTPAARAAEEEEEEPPPAGPGFRSGLRDEELGLPRRAPRLAPRR